ncbi:MAG: TonB-dependent receptor [Paludibacter sp.]
MKQLFIVISIFFLTSLTATAQHSIQSMVFDGKNGLALEMATVRLLNPTDSSLVSGGKTNSNGSFTLSKLKPGNYTLLISMVGYKDHRQSIKMDRKDLILKNIQMEENALALKEVEVKGTAAQMVVKGDTMEYNATAFKTADNAVVEDLLKRLPGVEVSTEGKITVNGQEIKKIRVDGKKFFSDDVEMTTKNIPADMIEKIQVLEQKSDMAQLTGFEDNDTERIINLTTKPSRRKGVFGNVTAGGGLDTNLDARYDGNAFVNIMNGNAQTAITGGANNVNTTRSSRGRNWGGGNNAGITTTQNLGINNNTLINPKLKIGGDALFNHSENNAITQSKKESYLKDLKYNNNDSTGAINNNYSTNMRLEVEWKPDSLNTFVIQPNMSYNRTFSNSDRDYLYLTQNDSTSWGESHNNGNGSGIDGGLNFIYNRKFAKKGRTLTANFNAGISQSTNDSWNYSLKNTLDTTIIVDQKTRNTSDRYNFNFRLSFVEPLWNVKNLLETSVSFRNTISNSEKNQYNKDSQNEYTLRDSVYSNVFENTFYSETLELNYRYTEQNYNLMLGAKAEPSQTYSIRTYNNGLTRPYTNEVVNFAPTGRFQYNFAKKKFVRIDYRGQTDQPTISQMQPVKNNSNLMNETVGNPTLNPAFNHNFRMFYSSYNEKTFSSFNTMLMFNGTKDALVSNSIYDATGKQYNQTVNAKDVPYNINGNIMFNTPIIQKRLHFNTNSSLGYNMRYGYSKKGLNTEDINIDNLPLGDLSSTRRYNASEQLSLTFTHDMVEVGASGTVRYSNTLNNLNPTVAETWDYTGRGNLVLHLPYNINVSSDINYTTRSGYSNFDMDELIWNASIDKSLFKGKGTLALKWNDILRQQLNIRQIIGDNYIQYSKYNTLTSYFMLSFSYKINKFNGNRNPAERNPDFQRFGPGGGDGEPRRGNRGGGMGGYDGPPPAF